MSIPAELPFFKNIWAAAVIIIPIKTYSLGLTNVAIFSITLTSSMNELALPRLSGFLDNINRSLLDFIKYFGQV